MQLYCIWLLAAASVSAFRTPSFHHDRQAQALPEDHTFRQGDLAAGDVRSPCPALNTLANHGFISRTGKDMTEEIFVPAIMKVYGFDQTIAKYLSSTAIKLLADKSKPGVINLDDLARHNVTEHDASLTRFNLAQGDNHSLQPALLHQLLTITKGDTLGVPELAYIRKLREEQSLKEGGKELKSAQNNVGMGEAALMLQTFGTANAAGDFRASKELIATWIGEEKLPPGWAPVNQVTMHRTLELVQAINSAKGLLKGTPPPVSNRLTQLGGDDSFIGHGFLVPKE